MAFIDRCKNLDGREIPDIITKSMDNTINFSLHSNGSSNLRQLSVISCTERGVVAKAVELDATAE